MGNNLESMILVGKHFIPYRGNKRYGNFQIFEGLWRENKSGRREQDHRPDPSVRKIALRFSKIDLID